MYNLAEQTCGKLHSGDSLEVFCEQLHSHYITSWSLFSATQSENLFWTGMMADRILSLLTGTEFYP